MIDILLDDGVEMPVDQARIQAAVMQTCTLIDTKHGEPELCIRFATDDVVQTLNVMWRQQDKVTDVLSFPMQDTTIIWQEPLGDVILATDFVKQEAIRLGIAMDAHVLHLIVHGVLHLLGFDHIEDDEAEKMQQYERDILKSLDLHDPYSNGQIQ